MLRLLEKGKSAGLLCSGRTDKQASAADIALFRLPDEWNPAMDTDDLAPPPKPKPENIEEMSIEELEARIAGFEAEIERARAMIASKKAARGDADSVFKI
jgi:uncharacterized small protein (DUF1192 family)